MNATVTIGITNQTGITDVMVVRHDRQVYLPCTKITIKLINVHNNITNASFVRLARYLAEHGIKTHENGQLLHYKII